MPTPSFVYDGVIVNVVDGDTYDVRVDLGFRVSATVRVRLHGYNAPEHGTPDGDWLTQWVRMWHLDQPVTIQSYHDRHSFERWVCDVWDENGRHFATLLPDTLDAHKKGTLG